MRIIQEKIKCIVCGKESEQLVALSYHSFGGTRGLDYKPSAANMMNDNIQQCPYCHYCNYNISKAIQSRFENNENALEIWENCESVQAIINSKESDTTKKYLILANQYHGNMDAKNEYNALVRAYWSSKNEKYLNEALKLYNSEIISEKISELIQYGDLLRQNKNFKEAQSIFNAVAALVKSDDTFTNKLLNYEKDLITKKCYEPRTTFDMEFDD